MRMFLMLIGLAVVIYAGWWVYDVYFAPTTVTVVEEEAVVGIPN